MGEDHSRFQIFLGLAKNIPLQRLQGCSHVDGGSSTDSSDGSTFAEKATDLGDEDCQPGSARTLHVACAALPLTVERDLGEGDEMRERR